MGNDSTPTTTRVGLDVLLPAAVELEIARLEEQGGPWDGDREAARAYGELLAGSGDQLLYRGAPGQARAAFVGLAKAIAVAAFAPGGVEYSGRRYVGTPYPTPTSGLVYLPPADVRVELARVRLEDGEVWTARRLADEVGFTYSAARQALHTLDLEGFVQKVPSEPGSHYPWLGWRRAETPACVACQVTGLDLVLQASGAYSLCAACEATALRELAEADRSAPPI